MTEGQYVPRKEGKNSLTLRTVFVHEHKNSRTMLKNNERLITTANNSISNLSTDRKITKRRKQKWEDK